MLHFLLLASCSHRRFAELIRINDRGTEPAEKQARTRKMHPEDHLRGLDSYRGQSETPELEVAARAAVSVCVGRILSDPEWAHARHNLLEVARILRRWERQAMTNQREDSSTGS